MTSPTPTQHRRLIVLGSTGSIGTNALSVVEHLRAGGRHLDVVGLASGRNAAALLEQARRFEVEHVAIANSDQAAALDGIPHVHCGPDAAERLVAEVARPGDLVLGAMVGSAGLPATLTAIERGCDVALANKETLVAAGSLVMPRVRERGVQLLPVDSEHSAIFQCLAAGRGPSEVRRIVLTASGGPFRTWPRDRIHNASVEETLAHPTWRMGPKVTVDSASLMNKALEVIEAHWLFGFDPDQIEVVIHPQSVVHSFVEFVDGSVVAQLSPPDMKSPIQYALTWPDRVDGCARQMDWSQASRLDFEPVDHDRFPALKMAWRVAEAEGTAGALFNAANEAAVAAFLEHRIPFGRIWELVAGALDAIEVTEVGSLEDVELADAAAREFVQEAVSGQPSAPSPQSGKEAGLVAEN